MSNQFIDRPKFGTIPAALAEMHRLIRLGREFPDACYMASANHSVDYSDLADAYDEEDRQRNAS